MKVLVIEEDKFIGMIYETEFHQENIEVSLAEDGKAGIEMAKKDKPNIILMGLMLAKMNGFDVIKELKKDKITKDIPIVVTSLLNQKKDIDEVISLGAAKYLSKDDYSPKRIVREVMEMLIKM